MKAPITLVLASGNSGKIKEFNELLKPLGFDVIPQSDFPISEVDETGLTFVENALLKARHASSISGLPALADDSGLEVDALKGAPGIYSARYAGYPKSDQRNNAKLIESLVDIPSEKRTARYWCVLVYLRHSLDPVPLIVQTCWEGEILFQPRGSEGFGYDPLFWIPEKAMSVAELRCEEKNRLSHRGRALRILAERLVGA